MNRTVMKIPEPPSETDRCITVFPQPYLMNVTPYNSYDFDPYIVANCLKMPSFKMAKVVIVGDQSVGKSSLLQRFCYNTFKSDYKSTIGVDFEVEKFQILGIPFKIQFWDTAGQERFRCIAASYYRGSKAVIVVFDLSNVESLMNAKDWAQQACKCATTIINENYFINKTSKNAANSTTTTTTTTTTSSCNKPVQQTDTTSVTNMNHGMIKNSANKTTHVLEWADRGDRGDKLEGPLLFLVGTKRDLVSDRTWKDMEHLASKVARDIHAELWIVSSKTGERVNDLFFRLAALLFEELFEKEQIINGTPNLQFANDLIKVEDDTAKATKTLKLNCC